MKMTELLPLKVYSSTLISANMYENNSDFGQFEYHVQYQTKCSKELMS